MRKLQVLSVAISLMVLLSCSKKEEPGKAEATKEQKTAQQKPQAQKSALENTIDYLTSAELGGRKYNSPGAQKAAQYIADKFMEHGLKPAGENGTYFQKFKDGTNVLAMLPGTVDEKTKIDVKDQIIAIVAHHDAHTTEGKICPGADDNASGVATLIDVAKQLRETGRKPYRSILFISFDAEEKVDGKDFGMVGSWHFVNSGLYDMKKIAAVICMDLVGGNLFGWDGNNLYAFGTEYTRSDSLSKTLSFAIDMARQRPNIDKKPPITQDELKKGKDPNYLKSRYAQRSNLNIIKASSYLIEPLPGSARSDYGPFRDKGVPYVFFTTGTPWYYHTPDDTKDKIDFKKLDIISDFIFKFVLTIGFGGERFEFTPDPVPSPQDLGFLLNIINGLLSPNYKSKIDPTRITQLEELKPKLEDISKKVQGLKGINFTTAEGRKALEDTIDKTTMQKATATVMAIALETKFELEKHPATPQRGRPDMFNRMQNKRKRQQPTVIKQQELQKTQEKTEQTNQKQETKNESDDNK